MMDFLDPKKTRASTVRLLVGYVLMGITLILATYLLLNLASGYGVQEGKVIQNGLVFVSTNPSGASIYLNDQKNNEATNARLVLPSGTYTMRLAKNDYRDWQRALTVEGGSVEHFDYPLLIPTRLATTAVSGYAAAPSLSTESPDRRWLMVQPNTQSTTFDVYDLRDPQKVLANKKTINVPTATFSLPINGEQSFKLVEWSRDNDHVLLQHIVGEQSEYVMVSRTKPEESFNVTKKLELVAGSEITLQDKKFDRYFIHDTAAQTLTTAKFDDPTRQPLLGGVLAYKTYGQDVVVYATASKGAEGKVDLKLYQDKQSYTIRQVAQDTTYLLDISSYDSDWYVAVGTAGENHVYIYKNPVDRLERDASLPLVPVENLKLNAPNYIEFSANSQFLMAENAQDIATYDAENERSYTYKIDKPLDAPQSHIKWMDGYHLAFVSGKAVTIFDYDGTNIQTLSSGTPDYQPFFDTSYSYLYTLAPAGTAAAEKSGAHSLYSTPLKVAQDL